MGDNKLQEYYYKILFMRISINVLLHILQVYNEENSVSDSGFKRSRTLCEKYYSITNLQTFETINAFQGKNINMKENIFSATMFAKGLGAL